MPGELLRKRALLVPTLQAKGFTVLNADVKPENASCIVSFFQPGKNLHALNQKLTDAGVVASLRTDRKGQNYIRLSPHFYNTDAELHRMLKLAVVSQISSPLQTFTRLPSDK